jgi:hypothetical protein
MTAGAFRRLALEISGAVEAAHMNHPDFRIGGKVFASLGYPDDEHGMLKLTPPQQRALMRKAPGAFGPCAGAWGKRGCTSVVLAPAKTPLVRSALAVAAKNIVRPTSRSRRPSPNPPRAKFA